MTPLKENCNAFTDLTKEFSPLQEIIDLVKENPNNEILGELIRNYITKYHINNEEQFSY